MTVVEAAPAAGRQLAPDRANEHTRLTSTRPFEGVIGLALALFVSLQTLEWVTFTGFAGGFVKPFHLGIALVAALALACWRPGQLIAPALRRHGAVYLSYFLAVGVGLAGGLTHAVPYLSRTNGLRQAVYAATSLLVAGLLLKVLRRPRVQRALAWTGVLTVGVVTTGLAMALATQRVNPLSLVREALVKADPDVIIYGVLRSAFRSEADLAEVGANLRHKVFLAVLLGVCIGLAFLPTIVRRARVRRGIVITASVIGVAMVLLSLSRSAIVCLVAPLLLVPLRALVRRRARSGQMVLAGLSLVVALGLAVSPVADILATRFASSDSLGSYESRLAGAGPKFLDEFDNAALLGAAKPDTPLSPHNLVLDAWLSGGVVAGIAMLVLVVALALTWLRLARSYVQGGQRWRLPISQLWVLAIGVIPLVRAVTAGNQFHLIEWTAVAFFLAIVSSNSDVRREAAP